ncbi:MAG: hypothetical protein Q8J92_12650, partial [Parvibaculum sp.]|nr:hypothetical protein [Parvibaculum sp.]
MGQNCEVSIAARRTVILLAGLAMTVSLAACAQEGPSEPVRATMVNHGVETRTQRQGRLTE